MKRKPHLSDVLAGAPLACRVVCCDRCGVTLDWLDKRDQDAYGDEIYDGEVLCMRCSGKLPKPLSNFWRKRLP